MSEQRLGRIAGEIQRELSELIRLELRDPRVRLVTITAVELARDQAHAKVFFTALGTPEQVEACARGLERASGFLRSALSHRLTTRTVPQLAFVHDVSVERGARLARLIDEAVRSEAPAPLPAPARARKKTAVSRTRGAASPKSVRKPRRKPQ